MDFEQNVVFPKYLKKPSYYSDKIFIFIDISGFTPLCDEFIKNSKYGAEKIGDLLNTVFSPIIDTVYQKNGDIISFAGDAIFASIDKKNFNYIKSSVKKIINNYSKKIKKKLSVTIEIFNYRFYPHILKANKRKHFLYYNKRSSAVSIYTKDVFPPEIFETANSDFKGELRAIPVFFIHINKKFSLKHIEILLKEMIDTALDYAIYINKIEYLDKGWMILLSSGLPIYSVNSQYKILDYLFKIIKVAKKNNIEISIGGTLKRGYAGIIGNNKRWEYTFIGSNVNLAARIAINAKPYQIYTDNDFIKTVNNRMNVKFIGKNEYKGIDKSIDIYSIINYKKNKEKTVFVGRKEELKQSLDYLDNPNSALIVWGSSGIGKTEFVKQIVNKCGKHTIILKGIHNNQTPFYLFDNFLKQLNKNHLKTSKRELIQKLFRNIKKQTFIFIDDICYADEYSKEMIKWIVSEGSEYVNLIMTAFTKNEIEEIIPPVKTYKIKTLPLSNLKIEDIQVLFYEYTAQKINKKTAKNIINITNGNPLFLIYLIKFMGKDIIKSPDTPYSLKELILLRINELPYNGEDFIDGGAVYGDVFNALIVADAMKFNKNKLQHIVDYAIHHGLIYILNDFHSIVFSNTIIRETIYETLLEKQINYIRIKLAEIISDNNEYSKAKHIAAQLFYLAKDKRCLDIFHDLIINEKKDYEYQRSYYIKYFNFIIKNSMYDYPHLLKIFDYALDLPLFYFNRELAELLYNISIKIKQWNKKEHLILKTAMTVSSFLMDNKKANILLEVYKNTAGTDKYFKWKYNVINKYTEKPEYILKTYKEIENKFKDKEKINFYLNYLGYAFFIIGDVKLEKYILKQLKKLEKDMDKELKAEYYQLLNSLSMHRDNIEQSIKYLNRIKNMKLNNRYYKFLSYNDLAIIYNQIGIKKLDNRILRRSLIYMIKAYKFIKDAGMKTNMPLITTNLGSSYESMANLKKTIKYYYEGYLYGKDINHPIELPYTMSRISRLAYLYGANELAKKLSLEIIEKHKQIGDLLPTAYTILYTMTKNEKFYLKGLNIAQAYLKNGVGKCIGEIVSILFRIGFIENNIKLLNESYKLMKKYQNKIQKRSIQKFIDDIMFEILEINLKNKNTDNLKKLLKDMNKINKLFTLKVIIHYTLAEKEINKTKKKEFLNNAYLIAKKIHYYSIYDKIFEFDKQNKLNLISNRSIAQLNGKKKAFQKISSIEEFYKFFN